MHSCPEPEFHRQPRADRTDGVPILTGSIPELRRPTACSAPPRRRDEIADRLSAMSTSKSKISSGSPERHPRSDGDPLARRAVQLPVNDVADQSLVVRLFVSKSIGIDPAGSRTEGSGIAGLNFFGPAAEDARAARGRRAAFSARPGKGPETEKPVAKLVRN